MGYSQENKEGTKYYLHGKGHLYYFSKKKEGNIDLPKNLKVIENKRTGLPLVKKK
jgi:hypothetical protein